MRAIAIKFMVSHDVIYDPTGNYRSRIWIYIFWQCPFVLYSNIKSKILNFFLVLTGSQLLRLTRTGATSSSSCSVSKGTPACSSSLRSLGCVAESPVDSRVFVTFRSASFDSIHQNHIYIIYQQKKIWAYFFSFDLTFFSDEILKFYFNWKANK